MGKASSVTAFVDCARTPMLEDNRVSRLTMHISPGPWVGIKDDDEKTGLLFIRLHDASKAPTHSKMRLWVGCGRSCRVGGGGPPALDALSLPARKATQGRHSKPHMNVVLPHRTPPSPRFLFNHRRSPQSFTSLGQAHPSCVSVHVRGPSSDGGSLLSHRRPDGGPSVETD